MDPKALSNLDPKLRETYERVMGTQAPAATTPSISAAPASTPLAANDGAPVTASPQLSSPPPLTGASPFSAPPVQPVNPWQASGTAAAATPFAAPGQSLPSPASITGQTKAASPVLRVLYIVGAVIFFVVYTIFWIKVFKLPFLF